jgi:hypothetical protein
MTAPPDPGQLLAYVFWHWKQAAIAQSDYESRQRDFHSALASAPSEGFVASFSVALSGAPWAARGGDAYEDWYLVRDFGALGALNEAAVTAGRALPHDAAAAAVADGAGGLCGLRLGAPDRAPRYAHWFGKPAAMSYAEVFRLLAPLVETASGALWMRQMVLVAGAGILPARGGAGLPARSPVSPRHSAASGLAGVLSAPPHRGSLSRMAGGAGLRHHRQLFLGTGLLRTRRVSPRRSRELPARAVVPGGSRSHRRRLCPVGTNAAATRRYIGGMTPSRLTCMPLSDLDQRPLNIGARFSPNARMPSVASSVSKQMFCAMVSIWSAPRRSRSSLA